MIKERDDITQRANEQITNRNKLIEVLVNARIEISGGDPDLPHGPVSLQVRDGKHVLSIADVPPPEQKGNQLT